MKLKIENATKYRQKAVKISFMCGWLQNNIFHRLSIYMIYIYLSLLYIYIYIYIYMYVCVCVWVCVCVKQISVVCPKKEINVLKWIGRRRHLYFLDLFISFLHTCIFREKPYMARSLMNAVLNETWTRLCLKSHWVPHIQSLWRKQ